MVDTTGLEGIFGDFDPSQYGVEVQPGVSLLEQLINAAVQKYIADIQNVTAKEEIEQQRQLQEAQLAASPGNFVAYQLYKRALESAGVTPTTGPANTNQEIQAAYNAALGFTPQGQPPVAGMTPTQAPAATGNTPLDDYLRRVQIGAEAWDPKKAASLGYNPSASAGQFGVTIPKTGEFSRSQFQNYSADELATLGSFLQAGVKQPSGGYVGLDPNEYFKEVQEGFIPTFSYTGPTKVSV